MNVVFPVNYDLQFEPDFKKFRFRGKEKVEIKVSKHTKKIVHNTAEFEIK